MHTLEIPDKKETYLMASEMGELNGAQYLAFCKTLFLLENGKITHEAAELALVIAFAEVRFGWRYALMSRRRKELAQLGLLHLTPLVKSVFEERSGDDGAKVLIPSLSFIDNKIPRFRGLTGPGDALQNCTFYEYKEAYAAWYQYQNTQDPAFLDEMIAILYRPAKPFLILQKRQKTYSGDPRIPLSVKSNPLQLQRRVRRVAKWPAWVKYGIWLWFTACMQYLRTGKPVIDGLEIDLSILYQGDEGGNPGIGLTGVLYSLAETGVFGGLRETGDSNLYDVLARLYQVKLQMDELKEKSKSKSHD
jgi:hypothetical protein